MELENGLREVFLKEKKNPKEPELLALKKLKRLRSQITIKPADKNLGIVVLNTKDYVSQNVQILQDHTTYKRVSVYPLGQIKKAAREVLFKFSITINTYNKSLWKFLLPDDTNYQVPHFYGIPKIHKQFDRIPPMRPIVANCGSILAPIAKLIDHVLQPISQSYPDCLHNSSSLSKLLESLHVPENVILVTLDVESLYPSIPQSDCLRTVYEEMNKLRHLLLFEPNLIIQLLHLCVNHNYFEFASLVFQQIQGTLMGAAFSPTIANIFMSVVLREFLGSQSHQPLLIKRYIDDLFILWEHGEALLKCFLSELNQFHQNLNYKHSYSSWEVTFLDLVGYDFQTKLFLDTRTHQKPQNLYQYLHFSSNHPRQTFKALITGELIRYVCTNTTLNGYSTMCELFKGRLLKRRYPKLLVDKTVKTVCFAVEISCCKSVQNQHPESEFPCSS